MELTKLNQWLTLAANVGVLLGIVFLSIEIDQQGKSIDQANRISIATAETELFSRNIDWFDSIIDNPEMAELSIKLATNQELSMVERARTSAWTNQVFQIWLSSESYYENGLISADIFEAMLGAPAGIMSQFPGMVPFVEYMYGVGSLVGTAPTMTARIREALDEAGS